MKSRLSPHQDLELLLTRPRYRYSVIPGGIRTAAELVQAMRTDPVVAAHYAGVNSAAVRFLHQDHDRDAFVSYRVGNAIFWTRHRVRLARGETIVTDGVSSIRGRCGNRISETPQFPVQAWTDGHIDEIVPPTDPLPIGPIGIYQPGVILPPEVSFNPAPTPFPEHFDPITRIDAPGIPEPVPEPVTFLLSLSGMAFGLIKLRCIRMREDGYR